MENAPKAATVYLICGIVAECAHVFVTFEMCAPFSLNTQLAMRMQFRCENHLRFCFIPCEHATEREMYIN